MYRSCLDSRDMKAAYVVSDENGYYDSQNIISCQDWRLGLEVLSCILHHSRNHEGGAGLTLCSTRSTNGGKTWSPLRPVEEPATLEDRNYYGVEAREEEPRQSHDGYQLLGKYSQHSLPSLVSTPHCYSGRQNLPVLRVEQGQSASAGGGNLQD